jgi:hypothetical protein
VRDLRLSERLLRAAHEVAGSRSVFDVEFWASGWLGQAWVDAGMSERNPEHLLCLEVVGRASSRPSPAGLAAVAALRRVAPPSEDAVLDSTIALLSEHHPRPPWVDEPAATPVAAWRAVDVWDSEHVLFVDFDAPRPHTLVAVITTVGGVQVDKLGLLEWGAAASWDDNREDDDVPMPISPVPVDDALTELADALQVTDITWPRHDDEDFVDLRALAWSRCRAHLPARADLDALVAQEEQAVAEHPALVEEFLQQPDLPAADPDVTRSLADLFLDYGDGYIRSGPLAWSPSHVAMFLVDWLPRKAVLDADQRAALPDTLRRWLRFALTRRGVAAQWITPVVQAVDEALPAFEAAFDDDSSWGPAKQMVAQMEATGIDLTDEDAVQAAIGVINAQNLATRALESRDRQ